MIRTIWAVLLVVGVSCTMGCGRDGEQVDGAAAAPDVSGRLEAGLRVLTFDAAATDQVLRVYRGDYVRVELSNGEPFRLEIPALEVVKEFPAPADERPYFKVPDAGTFEFSIGAASGTIEALEYRAAAYREVTARDAAGLIENLDPIVLDVRTAREFEGGHLPNAKLIPVQVFRGRLRELASHKDSPVFVYCRTGNRSTVAAKMLVDAGFTQVINLRRGIVEWQRAGLPTVK